MTTAQLLQQILSNGAQQDAVNHEAIELLKQIAKNSIHQDSVQIALISASAAVAGSIVTAIFSYFVSFSASRSQNAIEVKKLHASLVTTERLRWLQDIRQRLSKLFTQLDMQYNFLKRPTHAITQDELDKFSIEVMEQSNVIYLMLNPQKPVQATLRTSIREAQAFLKGCFPPQSSFDDNKYKEIKQKAFDSLTTIGTEAWDRIKNLE